MRRADAVNSFCAFRWVGKWALGSCLFLSALLPVLAQTDSGADLSVAKRIYEQGILPSGASLIGRRADGTVVSGRTAACANCHRPSGMGMVESDIQVPPITGRFLFPAGGDVPTATMDPRIGKRMSLKRDPHTDETLAQAIRTGRGVKGQELSVLMPRYKLSDAEVALLTGYLRQLSVKPSAGVEARTIRFATVIAPGVEPERKKIMLDMLRTALVQKNGSTVVGNASRRHMVTAAELVLGTENKWVLDIWELKGAPETWAEQLRGYYELAPPFALVSGLSNSTWEPVESFCEAQKIPCWFPSVSMPPERVEQPKYAFYYTRGLGLESDVLAKHLRDTKAQGQLVQLVRGGDAGMPAAQSLARQLGEKGLNPADVRIVDLNQWSNQELPTQLARELQGMGAADTVVTWLRPADLRAVESVLAKTTAQRFASGTLLSGSPILLPESLRSGTKLVFPYEMPQAREGNVGYMFVWLKLRRIPLVDEALQSEVYFALNFLTDTMAELLDNLYRDYMVERAESMIGQRESRKAEDEMRDQGLVRPRVRNTPMNGSIPPPTPTFAPGYAEHTAGKREGTTIYPRLSLGPGQRYASKGAYIARYIENGSGAVRAETDWIVP